MGGLLSITGAEDGSPAKVGVAITDICAGLFCHGAIIAALFSRDRTGKGQKIDISLLEAQVATLANAASYFLVSGQLPKRMGTAHSSIVPYQAFETSDGHIIVGALNDHQFVRLCEALHRPDLIIDERFKSNPDRVKHREFLVANIQKSLKTRCSSEWIQSLETAKVPCGPINNMQDVFCDPQVLHREMVYEIDHPTAGMLKQVGIPVKFSETKQSVRFPPPILSQHTTEVLTNLLCYDKTTVIHLKNIGVIG